MNEPQSGDQFKSYLKSVANGGILNQSEMRDAIHLILEGKVSDIQAAGFLMALRARGETVQEITAAATAMRDLATPVIVPDHLHDKLMAATALAPIISPPLPPLLPPAQGQRLLNTAIKLLLQNLAHRIY